MVLNLNLSVELTRDRLLFGHLLHFKEFVSHVTVKTYAFCTHCLWILNRIENTSDPSFFRILLQNAALEDIACAAERKYQRLAFFRAIIK